MSNKASKYIRFDSPGLSPSDRGLEIWIRMTFELLVASGFPDDEVTARASITLGQQYWQKQMDEIRKKGVKQEIQALLKAKIKKEAQAICRKTKLTHEEFANFVALSKELGLSHHQTNFEILPSDLEGKKIPHFAHLKETGEVYFEGDTDLTEGQLKHLIQNRKYTHIHFFEIGSEWHCFYFTFADLKGKHWGSQHLHYLSHLWTTPKEVVIPELKKKRYAQLGDHIAYELPNERPVFEVPSNRKK